MTKISRLIILAAIAILMTSNSMALSNKALNKNAGTFSKIEEAFNSGQITNAERIVYNVQAVYRPKSLPAEFTDLATAPIKSGTGYALEALENWDQLSPEQQSLLTELMNRPPYDTTYISPDSHFAVHYDTIGSESVPLEDLNANDIPDYVERVGLYADSVFRAYANLSYLPVPSDGDQYYDIYLLSIGAYGITTPESPGDSSWDDYNSFMQMHCSFIKNPPFPENDDPEGDVIGAQKVTAAHEYFHATQMAYNAYQDRWWMECTAVLFEELLYPEVNDNYQYLPYFFNFPKDRLNEEGTWHQYASFVWAYYLVENFGIDIIRNIYEYGRYYSSLPSTDSALTQFGEKVESVFPEFTLWNYFTDTRASMGESYIDAAVYPPVKDTHITGLPYSGYISTESPDGLAANYLIFYPDPSDDGYVRFFFEGNPTSKWDLTYLTFSDGNMETVNPTLGSLHSKTQFGYYDIALLDSIAMIPCVVSKYLDDNDYTISSDLVKWGDLDTSGVVNLLDILYLIDFKFKNGPAPPYEDRLADFDCDGAVNLLDILYLIDFKFKHGPAPGPCRD